MLDIDAFAAQLLEEAKRFLENAVAADDQVKRDASLHAALMLGFSSLEAHVNAICDEFASRKEFSVHERAFLLEKEIKMESGQFKLGGLKMSRLEDRIAFLQRHFSGTDAYKQSAWYAHLGDAIKLRNKLTHPKEIPQITSISVKTAITAIIDSLDSLYRTIYKKGLPAANRGLQSKLTF